MGAKCKATRIWHIADMLFCFTNTHAEVALQNLESDYCAIFWHICAKHLAPKIIDAKLPCFDTKNVGEKTALLEPQAG